MTSTLNAAEQAAATDLRTQIAPLLANGVVCAMRDNRPTGRLHGRISRRLRSWRRAGGARPAQIRAGVRAARLGAGVFKGQLAVAREERARRLPSSSDAEALRKASLPRRLGDLGMKLRRLKRLVRSMKIKISGLLARAAGRSRGRPPRTGRFGLGGENLCRQLSADFGGPRGDEQRRSAWQRAGMSQGEPNSACLLARLPHARKVPRPDRSDHAACGANRRRSSS